jgi:hypothetical protein
MVKSEKKSFPSSSFFFKHSFPEKGSFWCQIEFTKMKFILFRSPGEIGYLSWLSFKSVFGIILQLLFNWIRIRGKCSHWAKLHHYLASQSNDVFRLLSVLAIPRIILPRKCCTETTDILQSKKCLAEGSPALLSFYNIVNKKKLEHSPICPGKSDSWLILTTIPIPWYPIVTF